MSDKFQLTLSLTCSFSYTFLHFVAFRVVLVILYNQILN